MLRFNRPAQITRLSRSHLARSGIHFAAVCNGESGMYDVHHRQAGAAGSAPQDARDTPFIGTSLRFEGAPENAFTWPNRRTATDIDQTFAAILQLDSFAAAQRILGDNTNGNALTVSVGGKVGFRKASSAAEASNVIGMTAGVPSFIIASKQGGANVQSYGILRMDTGQLLLEGRTQVALAPSAWSGTFAVGDQDASSPVTGNIAAAFMGHTYLGLEEIRDWARDPWSIFDGSNPRRRLYAVDVAVGGFFAPPSLSGGFTGMSGGM